MIDIDKLATDLREAAIGVEKALPHGTWDSVRAYHRAVDHFRAGANTEAVLALLDERDRLTDGLSRAISDAVDYRMALAAKERECEELRDKGKELPEAKLLAVKKVMWLEGEFER